MTRGKYANRAAASQARADALNEVSALRRENATLQARVEILDRANLEQQAKYHATTQALRSQVAAGTSERVAELDARCANLQEEITALKGKINKGSEAQDKLCRFVLDHYVQAHKTTHEDALQMVANMLGAKGYIAADEIHVRKLSTEAAQRIDQARGLRKALVDQETEFTVDARPW